MDYLGIISKKSLTQVTKIFTFVCFDKFYIVNSCTFKSMMQLEVIFIFCAIYELMFMSFQNS